jgi:hypothetical protein
VQSLRWFPFTFLAVVLAVVIVSAALIGDINLIEMTISILNRIEQSEVDDSVTACVLVVAAVLVDGTRGIRRAKRDTDRVTERQAEQLKEVHVTMRTIQDIMNNCLNQLQLLRLDAEGHVPHESLEVVIGNPLGICETDSTR